MSVDPKSHFQFVLDVGLSQPTTTSGGVFSLKPLDRCEPEKVCLGPGDRSIANASNPGSVPFGTLWSKTPPSVASPAPAPETRIGFEFDKDPGAGWLLVALANEQGLKVKPQDIDAKGDGDGLIVPDEVFRYLDQNPQLDFRALADTLEDEHAVKAHSYADYLEGKKALERGDPGDAEAYFKNAVALDPDNALAQRALGLLQVLDAQDAERRQEGAARLEESAGLGLSMEPEDLEALAEFFALDGELETAVKLGKERAALGFKNADGEVDWQRRDAFEIKLADWAQQTGDLVLARDILWPEEEMSALYQKYARENPDMAAYPYLRIDQIGVSDARKQALIKLHENNNQAWFDEAEKREFKGDYEYAIELLQHARRSTQDGILRLDVATGLYPPTRRIFAERDGHASTYALGDAYGDKNLSVYEKATAEIARLEARSEDYVLPGWEREKALPEDLKLQIYGHVVRNSDLEEDDVAGRAALYQQFSENGLGVPGALLSSIEEARRKAETATGAEAEAAIEEMNRYVDAAADTALTNYLQSKAENLDVSAVVRAAKFNIVFGAIHNDPEHIVKGQAAIDDLFTYVYNSEPTKSDGVWALADLYPAESGLIFVADLSKDNYLVQDYVFDSEEPDLEYLSKLAGPKKLQERIAAYWEAVNRGERPADAAETEALIANLEEARFQAVFESQDERKALGRLKAGGGYLPARFTGYTEGRVASVAELRRLNADIQTRWGSGVIQTAAKDAESARVDAALKENKHYQDRLDLEAGMDDMELLAGLLNVDPMDPAIETTDLENMRQDLIEKGKGLRTYYSRMKDEAGAELVRDQERYTVDSTDENGNSYENGGIDYDAVGAMTSYEDRLAYFKSIKVGTDDSYQEYRLLNHFMAWEKANAQIAELDSDLASLNEARCETSVRDHVLKFQATAKKFFSFKEKQVQALLGDEVQVANDAINNAERPEELSEFKQVMNGSGGDFAAPKKNAWDIEVCSQTESVGLQGLTPLDPATASEATVADRIQTYRSILDAADLVVNYGALEEMSDYYWNAIPDVDDGEFLDHIVLRGMDYLSGGTDNQPSGDASHPFHMKVRDLLRIQRDLLDPAKRPEALKRTQETLRAHVHKELRSTHEGALKTKLVSDIVAIAAAAATGEIIAMIAVRGVTGLTGAYRAYRAYRGLRAVAGVEELSAGVQFATRAVGGLANASGFTLSEPVFRGAMSHRGVKETWNQSFRNSRDAVYQIGTNWMMFGAVAKGVGAVNKGYDALLTRAVARSSKGGVLRVEQLARRRLAMSGVEATKEAVRTEMKAGLANRVEALSSKGHHVAGRWTANFTGEAAIFQGWGFGKEVGLDQTGQVIRGERSGWDLGEPFETHLGSATPWEDGITFLGGIRLFGGAKLVAGEVLMKGGMRVYDVALHEIGRRIEVMDRESPYLRNADYEVNRRQLVRAREQVAMQRDARPIATGFLGEKNRYGVRHVDGQIYQYSHGKADQLIADLLKTAEKSPNVLRVLDVWENGTVTAEFTRPDGEKAIVRLTPDKPVSKKVVDRLESDFKDEATQPDGLPLAARASTEVALPGDLNSHPRYVGSGYHYYQPKNDAEGRMFVFVPSNASEPVRVSPGKARKGPKTEDGQWYVLPKWTVAGSGLKVHRADGQVQEIVNP